MLHSCIRKSESLEIFKKRILMFRRLKLNTIYNIHNPLGIKYLTRLRIDLSHIKEHKFRHNFQDSIDSICNCGNRVETTINYFLHCANFSLERQTHFDNIWNVDETILSENDNSIVNTFITVGKGILKLTIECILSSECFNCTLY